MPLLQSLRETNQRLSLWFDAIAADSCWPAATSPVEPMAALLSELLRVGAALRAQPPTEKGVDLELDAELAKYRGQVERLRDLLPSIHRQLLAERARLEAQKARVQSAAQWARASRQTL